MTPNLHFSILIGIFLYFIIIIFLLRKRALTIKYTIVWLISGVFLFLFDLFPGLIEYCSTLLGFTLPANTLFTIVIFFILIILMSLTSTVSKLNEKIRTVAQHFALQEQKIRQLEATISMMQKKADNVGNTVSRSSQTDNTPRT